MFERTSSKCAVIRLINMKKSGFFNRDYKFFTLRNRPDLTLNVTSELGD